MGFFDQFIDTSYKKVVQHYELEPGEFFVDFYENKPVVGDSCDVWANGVTIIKTKGYSGEMQFPSGHIKIAVGRDGDGRYIYKLQNI